MASKKNLARRKFHRRRKVFVIVALVITLISAGGTLARWSGLYSMKQESGQKATEIAPAALTPTTPLKEYVYAGGKLTAIEEQ